MRSARSNHDSGTHVRGGRITSEEHKYADMQLPNTAPTVLTRSAGCAYAVSLLRTKKGGEGGGHDISSQKRRRRGALLHRLLAGERFRAILGCAAHAESGWVAGWRERGLGHARDARTTTCQRGGLEVAGDGACKGGSLGNLPKRVWLAFLE